MITLFFCRMSLTDAKLVNSRRRAAFHIDGDVFVSAGAMYYIKNNGRTYFLMQQRNDKSYLEDIGGKSEPEDESIEDLVKRETLEELNCLAPVELQPKNNPLNAEFLDACLSSSEQILVPESKYVLFFVKLPMKDRFDLVQYRNAEYAVDGEIAIGRTLIWISKTELYKSQLHPRIRGLEDFFP